MTSPEASVILGAAVIDDVMGLFVLAFLAASCSTPARQIPLALRPCSPLGCNSILLGSQHPLVVQMTLIAVCVTVFFVVAYGAAKRWLDPLMRAIPQARCQ